MKRTHLNHVRESVEEPDVEPIYKGV
jgi:hypothetical protein